MSEVLVFNPAKCWFSGTQGSNPGQPNTAKVNVDQPAPI